MRFKDFLVEQKEKHAVLAFGRMNPITSGHEKLVDKVKEISRNVGGSHHIVLSHSQDTKKNPLSGPQKVQHAKKAFPDTNFTHSTKESPNFLSQSADLHKKGVTHLHVVGGSDRVSEFKKTLNKYNGTHQGALYNFKKITVHSAGQRDPDSEGVSGMSASKMRHHATKGDFESFRKGVPSTMGHSHAKALYNDVRRGMGLKEDIDLQFEELLIEGVHDRSIFKAMFLAGGPGSGKDYVLSNTLDGHGLTEINSDKALEFLMDKKGLDKTMPDSEKKTRDLTRDRAKDITLLRQKLALLGRNGLIINGTGDDVEKISRIKSGLEKLGYDTGMIMVNTSDEISAQRNIERGQRGGRAVPETIRKEKWDAVQDARTEYAKAFGSMYHEYDNSDDLREAPPEVVKQKKMELTDIFKSVKEFAATPPQSDIAKEWVASELNKKDTLPVQKSGTTNVPSHESKAAEEAKQLGLQYYGFGRFGKNGVVTHRSVHDSLVSVEDIEKSKEKVKKEDIDLSFEEMINESYELSDSTALNLLLLGESIDENDFQIGEEKEVKLLKDKSGRVRIFILRAAAAKESHVKGGQVIKYKNGYVIKLKEENENDRMVEKLIYEKFKSKRDGSDRGREAGRLLSETVEFSNTTTKMAVSGTRNSLPTGNGEQYDSTKTTRKVLTLKKARLRQEKSKAANSVEKYQAGQEQTQESIDKGIEPGVSMASSGENFGRGVTKTKLLKKPFEEMTGDETGVSIGDQKELQLKRKGIDLSTFRSKKFV